MYRKNILKILSEFMDIHKYHKGDVH